MSKVVVNAGAPDLRESRLRSGAMGRGSLALRRLCVSVSIVFGHVGRFLSSQDHGSRRATRE